MLSNDLDNISSILTTFYDMSPDFGQKLQHFEANQPKMSSRLGDLKFFLTIFLIVVLSWQKCCQKYCVASALLMTFCQKCHVMSALLTTCCRKCCVILSLLMTCCQSLMSSHLELPKLISCIPGVGASSHTSKLTLAVLGPVLTQMI